MENTNPSEVTKFISEMEDGGTPGRKLQLNSKTGMLELVSAFAPKSADKVEITMNEAKMFSNLAKKQNPVLLINKEQLNAMINSIKIDNEGLSKFLVQAIDDYDVLKISESGNIKSFVYKIESFSDMDGLNSLKTKHPEKSLLLIYSIADDSFKAVLCYESDYVDVDIIVPPIESELFSRINGIFETDILANKRVAIIGLGSGGSTIALELIKQGVQNFILVDHDRLEIGNVARHVCGLEDLGRFKTKAMSSVLLNKNPMAKINTIESDITTLTSVEQKAIIDGVDLVICATDNRQSKMLVNRLCIENEKPCLYGGAFRRAYGGQVLRVLPNKSMCYQCFISQLPNIAEDNEVSSLSHAKRFAYADVSEIPIEPGLSTDILPISSFVVKLALLELLRNEKHTLVSLYEDFTPSLYIWFNRREEDTEWIKILTPLGANTDNMSIMRWYGIEADKNPTCSVCGEFINDEHIKAMDTSNPFSE